MGAVLLEVGVAHERDAAGAQAGGADRLLVVGQPGPAEVSGICHGTDLPVFYALEDQDDDLVTAQNVAETVLGCGVAGLSLGFLDPDLEVDLASLAELTGALPGVPWTFSRAIDDTLEPRRSWRRLLGPDGQGLSGLVNVCSAGSARGTAEGYDELLATAESDPAVARLLMAGGALPTEQVPWLVRAGVRALHLDSQVRPGGSRSARGYVDADLVRSWRSLADAAVARFQ